jgi:ABC-2 type transport system ATP-binding protein
VRQISVRTERRTQLLEITREVQEAVDGTEAAAALVFVPHTTAGVTINEHADPAVARDFERALERMVGEGWGWEHIEAGEENAPSHIRAALMGPQVGVPYRRLDRPLHRVGAVLEASEVHPGRTGRNHLRVLATAAGLPRSRVDEVLTLVELTAGGGRRVKGYSLGMRQRLGLAAAMLGDPEVLVLDEPANGLDPPGIRWMRELLRFEAGRGRAVLVSSHLLSEVSQSVDDIVVISHGVLRGAGPLEQVLGGSDGPVTRVRTGDAERLAGLLRAQDHVVEPDGDALLVRGAAPEAVGEVAAEHRVALAELVAVSRSLEDAFFELTEGTG